MSQAQVAPRVALIGARRVRQGLGPYVAKHLQHAGAQVVGFVGTSAASRAQAATGLREMLDHHVPGFASLKELVQATMPQAVAILSPPETHAEYLEQALELGLHTLCEKPLLWGPDGAADARRAAAQVAGFQARGLLLAENCQWPQVLDCARELAPQAFASAPTQFAMGLEPAAAGQRMVGDALSHPISLLQALAPGPAELQKVAASWSQNGAALDLKFSFQTAQSRIEALVELRQTDNTPRGAWLELNGVRFQRLVRLADYSMLLAAGERELDLDDPLASLLQGFVTELRAVLGGAPPPNTAALVERADFLAQLRSICQQESP
ncbi:MAG: putative dehydrogenase [Planctomycetota bacterium]